ncbi:MAG: major capsid protein [Microviridae sp.]|nr:MAG: major capsid protein [Microviridae sp.]
MHRNPSVMRHTFSEVPQAEIPRSTFVRSHGHKTTFDAGLLVPIYVDEALPGDTAHVSMTGFARMATPIFPIMDNMVMDTFFFSIPLRLVWENWQRFNGEQPYPGAPTDFVVPQITTAVGGEPVGSIYDYMGVPPQVSSLSVSALFFRAYNLVWNEWFRDQNLMGPVNVPLGDGPDPNTNYSVLRRGKRHDYFTSALPWPQKGPGVSIPLGLTAPVLTANTGVQVRVGSAVGVDQQWQQFDATGKYMNAISGDPAAVGNVYFGTNTGLFTDLSGATAATINSLRQAFQIQKIYERDARGGTRYTEIIKAHFGVSSPDARLQRPEFLGGGSSPVNIAPIPQTSASGAYADSPQGNLAAMGTSVLRNHGFTTSFTEHCIVLGLVCVRADLTYQQGLNRMFSRRSRFDFYWPALAHIGEQSVLQKEIFASGVPAQDDLVFGYQERFAEYRYKPSMISGQFRSAFAQSLDSWHLSQDFVTAPALNASFMAEDPPVDRVIAVPSEPHFLFDGYFKMSWARPMPVYGVPGLIDHF